MELAVIFVVVFVFGLVVGWLYGEAQAQAAFNAVPSYVEQQAARLAREMMAGLDDEGEIPIVYTEGDEPVHLPENGYRCGQRDCPCMIGHVVDGKIIVEQESV